MKAPLYFQLILWLILTGLSTFAAIGNAIAHTQEQPRLIMVAAYIVGAIWAAITAKFTLTEIKNIK